MFTSALKAAAVSACLLGLVGPSVGDDHLVSERLSLYKRQQAATKNITFLHINDVHAHLDEFRSSGQIVARAAAKSGC
jgi:5'-nucleotidase